MEAEGIIYMGSMQGEVLAISPESRIVNHSFPQETVGEWRFVAGGAQGGGLFSCAAPVLVSIYGTPALSEGFVYIGTSLGKVYCLNATSGNERWVYPEEGSIGSIVGSPVVWNGIVYVGSSDGNLYAIDAETGQLKAGFADGGVFQTGDKIWSTPLVYDGIIYFGSFDHSPYAIDAETGDPVWGEPFETEGAIGSTPFILNGTVYIGSFDNSLYAIDAETGEGLWSFPGENWFWADPATDGETIYLGCLDGNLYAIDAETGQLRAGFADDGVFQTGGPIRSTPVLDGEVLVVASQDGKVYAIDKDSGERIWTRNLDSPIMAPLSLSGDTVHVHTHEHIIYALAISDGMIVWEFDTAE